MIAVRLYRRAMHKHERPSPNISQNKPSVLLVRVDRAPNDDKPAAMEEVSRLFKGGDSVPPTVFLADDYDLKTRLE